MTTSSTSVYAHHAPLTAVALVCASRDGLATLAAEISAFIGPSLRDSHAMIVRACELGDVRLLQRLVDEDAAASTATTPRPVLYRSHIFSHALARAVAHDNDMALLECLLTYCPTGFASLGMEAAARVGKLEVMQWLETRCSENLIWSSRFADAAASNGHLGVLQWLATRFRPSTYRLIDMIKTAMTGGHFAVVKWLIEASNFCDFYKNVALEKASDVGDVDALRYLLTEHLSSIRRPLASGKVEAAQWLYDNGFYQPSERDITTAVSRRHIDLLRWLLQDDRVTGLTADRMVRIIERGDFEITQAFYEFRPELFSPPLLAKQLRGAAKAGDLALLKRMFAELEASEQDLRSLLRYEYTSTIGAAANGHLEVVQWLFANVREFSYDPQRAEEQAVSEAAGNGHADIVEWLHTNRSRAKTPEYKIAKAAEHGRLDLIKWMLQDAECADADIFLLEAAASSGDLATLQYLHERFDIERSHWDHLVIAAAVQKNHVHIAQWLHEQNYEGWSSEMMDNAPSLEMVKWFHYNRTEGCSTAAMDNAAARGDFDTLLFLHCNRTEGCTTQAAAHAQTRDHVVIARWLFQTYPEIMIAVQEGTCRHMHGMYASETRYCTWVFDRHQTWIDGSVIGRLALWQCSCEWGCPR